MSNTTNQSPRSIKAAVIMVARLILGLIYTVFGLNFFFHFIPMPPPAGGPADVFTGGLFQAGYFFPMLKGIEVLFGLLLLAGMFVPFSLVVLFPVTVNILLFHVFLTPGAFAMGAVMLVVHLFLAWAYRDTFKPMWVRHAASGL